MSLLSSSVEVTSTDTVMNMEGMDNQYGASGESGRRIDSAGPKRNANQYKMQQQQQQQHQQQQHQQQQQQHQQQHQQQQQQLQQQQLQHQQNQQQQHQQQREQEEKEEQQSRQYDGGLQIAQRDIRRTEDSLEYFIKFPAPSPSKPYHRDNAADASDLIIAYNDPNVPVVMLLGWAGCQDRYLMKYSKIYEDRGLITVRYTAPVQTLFWQRTGMVPIGEKILKLIYDMNFEKHPVIFHIFSNGGAYMYQHISLAIRKHRTPVQIRGMIFDSAPGERRVVGLYRAVSAIYGKDAKKCNFLTAIVITVTLSVMWFLEETFSAFKSLFVKSNKVSQKNPFNDLKNDPNKYPQMFIYSKGDVVIPYQDVEKFARIRREQGVEVEATCFEDAEHVKIFTKYPNQYIDCVCSFVNKCMSRPYREADCTSYESTPATSMGSMTTKYD